MKKLLSLLIILCALTADGAAKATHTLRKESQDNQGREGPGRAASGARTVRAPCRFAYRQCHRRTCRKEHSPLAEPRSLFRPERGQMDLATRTSDGYSRRSVSTGLRPPLSDSDA